jgi:ribonuclease T1
MYFRKIISLGFCVMALGLTMGSMVSPALAKSNATSTEIALADLPKQGQTTYQLILQGGPFPYEKDGTFFGNRERILPLQKRGYYREYTVKTPASRDRGAHRIVCGGPKPTQPDACFYTADHYATFKKIAP